MLVTTTLNFLKRKNYGAIIRSVFFFQIPNLKYDQNEIISIRFIFYTFMIMLEIAISD